MTNKNIPENLTQAQTDLNSRIFDLILGRVLKRAYLDFDKKIKENIKEIIASGDGKDKKLSKKNMPDLKNLFKEEAKNIEEEIKAEIEKQL